MSIQFLSPTPGGFSLSFYIWKWTLFWGLRIASRGGPLYGSCNVVYVRILWTEYMSSVKSFITVVFLLFVLWTAYAYLNHLLLVSFLCSVLGHDIWARRLKCSWRGTTGRKICLTVDLRPAKSSWFIHFQSGSSLILLFATVYVWF